MVAGLQHGMRRQEHLIRTEAELQRQTPGAVPRQKHLGEEAQHLELRIRGVIMVIAGMAVLHQTLM